ncbi:MAG: hypothetical protein H7A51_04035 [Akkermansiaceae bacterium]|nr:hypothetical protein [Akkermansiaceae bacterium]
MPNLIEDALATKLATWLEANRPEEIPSTVPIHVANRDELRTRPCIVLATSDTKPVSGARHTTRIKLDVHLFSQVDDTPMEASAVWAAELAHLLAGVSAIQNDLNDDTFYLHDLLLRDSSTVPDESRGRETVISYEAVVSAV